MNCKDCGKFWEECQCDDASAQSHAGEAGVNLTDVLAACPCGKTPTDVEIYDAGQGGKWANVQPNCCGEWTIEFRTNYKALDSEECKRLAREAWNEAPRAANAKGEALPTA